MYYVNMMHYRTRVLGAGWASSEVKGTSGDPDVTPGQGSGKLEVQGPSGMSGFATVSWWVLPGYIVVAGFLLGCMFPWLTLRITGEEVLSSARVHLQWRGRKKYMVHAPDSFTDLLFKELVRPGNGAAYEGKLSLDGNDVDLGKPLSLIYLCDPESIPGDLNVESYVEFAIAGRGRKAKERTDVLLRRFFEKRFDSLELHEIIEVILTVAEYMGSSLYIMRNFIDRMDLEEVRKVEAFLNRIKKAGAAVVWFNSIPGHDLPMTFDGRVMIYEENGKYRQEEMT